jgi:8-oxo-dGTP pyrophosphatase MutT (NUDIX family)
VAAILVLEDGRYLMQQRSARPDIWYPGHWGCFGGAVDAGEPPLEAMRRELREELEYEAESLREFTRFDFDFAPLGPRQKKVYRIYYEVKVSTAAFGRMRLHEGAGMEALEARRLLLDRPVTPYDAFAVWLHFSRGRF